jgi:ABC-type transporter Mla subunit MlaD
MSKSRLEWKVGLFVLIGLVLLGALLLQFSKGSSGLRRTYNIMLRTANVGGLKARSQVLMAGVQVGTVSDIKLGPQGTNVIIILRISGNTTFTGCRFVLEQSSFWGHYVPSPDQNQGELLRIMT